MIKYITTTTMKINKKNILSKSLLCIMSVALVSSTISCKEEKKEDKTEEKASVLLKEAQNATENSEFQRAYNLIDSLRRTYPKAIKTRKEALVFMPLIKKAEAESLKHEAEEKVKILSDSIHLIQSRFTLNKDSKYQTVGFYKYNNQPSTSQRNCLWAEVAEDGKLYLVSVVNGNKISHREIQVRDGEGRAANSSECISFLTGRSSGYSEESTFCFTEESTLLNFITSPRRPITITCKGTSDISYQLADADIEAIRQCYSLAKIYWKYNDEQDNIKSYDLKVHFYERQQQELKKDTLSTHVANQ